MWASECILGWWGGSVEPCSYTSPHRPTFLTPRPDLFQSRQPGDLGAPGESAQVLACVSGLGSASSRPRPLSPKDHGPCGHDRTCSVSFAGPCLSWSSWNSWIWEATIWKCWCGEGGAVVGGAGPGRVSEPRPSLCPCLFVQPDTLGALPNLRELWLDRNQLSALPPVSEGVAAPAACLSVP